MSARDHLHRLQVWQLAERRRYLADLESLAARLRADVERLRDEIGEPNGDAAQAQSVFARPLVERRDKLLGSIVEIDVQIGEAREAVATAEQEVRLRGGSLIQHGAWSDLPVTRRARRAI
jgi:flagellar FliJ protein